MANGELARAIPLNALPDKDIVGTRSPRREPMSGEAEKFSGVVGAIYEAALDAASWDDAVVRFVEAYSPPYWDVAFLVWEQAPQVGAQFVAAANVSPSARGLYATHFGGRHPWSLKIATQPVGRLVDTDDICPRAELFDSDLYRNFLSTWSIVRALAVVLDRDGDRRLAFLVSGPDGQDIEGLRRGARLVAPICNAPCASVSALPGPICAPPARRRRWRNRPRPSSHLARTSRSLTPIRGRASS